MDKFLHQLHHFLDFNKRYWLFVFIILSLWSLEFIYRIGALKEITSGYFLSIILAIPMAFLLYMLISILNVKLQKLFTILILILLTILYEIQLVYHKIFQVPLYLYSFTGAKAVMEFKDIILTGIQNSILGILLLLIPLFAFILLSFKLPFSRMKLKPILLLARYLLISFMISLLCVHFSGNGPFTAKSQYYHMTTLEQSIDKLGLITSMGHDLQNLIFRGSGSTASDDVVTAFNEEPILVVQESTTLPTTTCSFTTEATTEPLPTEPLSPFEIYNIMDIDFDSLIADNTDEVLLEMDTYFKNSEPTEKNAYTGLFEGYNLIFMTCEGFSPYAVSEELTPTLYNMIHSGFEFTNFYNPVWGVSTSDGEYVATQGLIPKSGVWSFSRSSTNYLPFTMGNQFRTEGYPTYAYHNHTYTYYDRDQSHPNLGYDYKGLGNGLEVKETWPESDLEMMQVTGPEFISKDPFHAYFMTVSGHLYYNFTGNYIAGKNKDYVKNLPYSDEAKAYIACNLELEFAVADLIAQLKAAGVLEKTVFVMSPDHYPYGLEKEKIDELAGHTVEENFELYKSTLIIWNSEMEHVVVDTPCESLDIIPTISNLFGLQYDSRLLMGTDILSNTPPLVIFANRSWITDRATYNSETNTLTFFDNTSGDSDYYKTISQMVNDKFKYSKLILENDYYAHVFGVK